MTVPLDFTRPPTAKERLKLGARLHRLNQPGQAARIDRLYQSMPGTSLPQEFIVRSGFSYREHDIDPDASDRKAPPRALRPPATRLMSPRGGALRFALTLLALAQKNRKPGVKARLKELQISTVGDSQTLGWANFLAADATDSSGGKVFLSARDKRARSVRSALHALDAAGLVLLPPGEPGSRNRFERFVLLNECGIEAVGEAEEYRVPTQKEMAFTMPNGFITNGWIHVLEDSEIALLLMVACHRGGWLEDELVVVPPDVRLKNYGIHRDAYSSARKMLEWCGLLEVEEMGRHEDGRAENAELRTHRLRLRLIGFEETATSRLLQELTHQLARS